MLLRESERENGREREREREGERDRDREGENIEKHTYICTISTRCQYILGQFIEWDVAYFTACT